MDVPHNQYATMTGAVNDLQAQGYTDELTLTEDGLFNSAIPLDPSEFTIDSFHRFEGPSDPADMAIIATTAKAPRSSRVGTPMKVALRPSPLKTG